MEAEIPYTPTLSLWSTLFAWRKVLVKRFPQLLILSWTTIFKQNCYSSDELLNRRRNVKVPSTLSRNWPVVGNFQLLWSVPSAIVPALRAGRDNRWTIRPLFCEQSRGTNRRTTPDCRQESRLLLKNCGRASRVLTTYLRRFATTAG